MKLLPWHWAPLLLLFILPTVGRGCMWIEGTTLEGALDKYQPGWEEMDPPSALDVWPDKKMAFGSVSDYLQGIRDLEPLEAKSRLNGPSKPPSDWPKELDQAMEPVFQLEHAEAKARLELLLLSYPDNYYVLANLGVVTELLGDDAGALSFIEKARRQKPDAHGGTEWMHEAVLKAKLALVKDPKWLQAHTITGLPTGVFSSKFTVQDGSRALSLSQVRDAVIAHAVPRLLFIKHPDPILAAMLTELARIEARLKAVEEGMPLLDMAASYGSTTASTLKQEWIALQPGPLKKKILQTKANPVFWIFLVLGAVLLALCMALLTRCQAWRAARKATETKTAAIQS